VVAGWTVGFMLIGIYYTRHDIPLWLAPVAGSATAFLSMWALK